MKQLTDTDEAAGRRCLSGLQVLIKQLTGADQLADILVPLAYSPRFLANVPKDVGPDVVLSLYLVPSLC